MQVVSLIGLKHVFYLVLYIPDDDTQVVTIIRAMYGGRYVDTQLKRNGWCFFREWRNLCIFMPIFTEGGIDRG